MHEDDNFDARELESMLKVRRYLHVVENVTWSMAAWERDEATLVDVHVDSDRLESPERKSTSGDMMMMMMINGTVVTLWSRTQASRALRTREAECDALVTGTADGLGMQSIMEAWTEL